MGRLGSRVSGRKSGERGYGRPVKKKTRRLGSRVAGRQTPVYNPSEVPETVVAAASAAAATVTTVEPQVDEVIEAPVTAKLGELEEALVQNPAYYETLYASEKTRVGGARKGALRMFLAHEMAHGNREDRLSEIHELLG